MKCKLIFLKIFLFSAFLIKDSSSIYDRNDGIKTKTYHRDSRISNSPTANIENQPIIMHHQYSQVVSNRPSGSSSQYSDHYFNQNQPSDIINSAGASSHTSTITTTATKTTGNRNYQGSSRVYQESSTHVNNNNNDDVTGHDSITNNRLSRTSSKIYDIENNLTPYRTECPTGATGQFAYALDCRRFLNCWKGRGHIQTCAPGTIFNPDTLECDDPKKVVCLSVGTSTSGRSEKLRDSPSVPRTVFSSTTNTAAQVKCSPGVSGVEAHPYDCTKFLNCAHGLTYVQNCGPGTVFNSLIDACDYPQNVDCGTRSVNLDVITSTSQNHDVRRVYNEDIILPTNTQTIQKVTTSYSNFPKYYGGYYSQQKDAEIFRDHYHTQGCSHHSHNSYKEQKDVQSQQNLEQTSWTQTNTGHTHQEPGTIHVEYPNNWNTDQDSSQPTGWSHTRNVTTIQSQTTGSGASNSNFDDDDDDVQRPSKLGSHVIVVYPEKQDENGQHPVKPYWGQDENQQIRTSTLQSQSHTRQTGHNNSFSYNFQPSGPIYTRQPKQENGETQMLWNATTRVQYTAPPYPSSGHNTQITYGTHSSSSYEPTYDRTWTTVTTTTQQRTQPHPWNYGNVDIEQAETKEIPQSNYDKLHSQIKELLKKTTSNSQISNVDIKVYHAKPVEPEEPNFDNIVGGDIQVQPKLKQNKNETELGTFNESDEETGQHTIPLKLENQNRQSYTSVLTTQENDNLYGGLLPPYSSSEHSPSFNDKDKFGSEEQLENTNEDLLQTQSNLGAQISIPIPSKILLPPYTDEEWEQRNKTEDSWTRSKTIINKNEKIEEADDSLPTSIQPPPSYMLPPMRPEEEQQKALNPFLVPSQQLLPPVRSEEKNQKNHWITSSQFVSSSSVRVPSNHMLPPMTPEEEWHKVRRPIPIPSEHMLPPMTPEEERKQFVGPIPIPSEHLLPPIMTPEEEHKKILSTTTKSSRFYSSVRTPPNHILPPMRPEEEQHDVIHIPSQHLMPPMSPEKELQKVSSSPSSYSQSSSPIPLPEDYMLPPMTPEEERQKAFNSSHKVVPLKPSGIIQPNIYSPDYSPSYTSVVLKNWTHTVSSSSSQTLPPKIYRTPKDIQSTNLENPPVSYSLNKEVDADQIHSDSILVESPPLRVTLPSLYRSTTTKPPSYSAYNREYYKGSSWSSSASTSSSSSSSTTNLPLEINLNSLPISEAMKLLLRPYLNRSGIITDEDIKRSESHIMKVLKASNSENYDELYPHEKKDVEFIFTGEQNQLNQVGIKGGLSNQQNSNNNYDRIQHQHHDHHENHHSHHLSHDPEFHKNNPHLPNPFEPSTHDNLESNGNHNHHHHHHHHGHSEDFHRRNPHLPNPFESSTTSRRGYNTQPTPLPDTTAIPVPDYDPKIDVRFSAPTPTPTRFPDRRQANFLKTTTTPVPNYDTDCQFDCQNGKCVKEFEVCDGVNNCGNRLDEKNCDFLGYEVRLSNEEGKKNMGRVEVKILNKWGYVCDDKFGMRDADVLCRELGFPLGASEVRGNSYYPPIGDKNDILFVMDEVDCKGNETSLKECDFKGWGVHDCTADEVVGVVCKIPVMKCPHDYWLCSTSRECIPPAFVCDNVVDCADKSDEAEHVCNSTIEYRLVDGDGRLEGRVEVKYRGKWGTICDDDFTDVEAEVICRSLGFHGKAKVVKNSFGPGSGPIWLDQVSCYGNETSIDKCIHWTWGEHNCNHTEDVSIRCSIGSISPNVENNGIKGRSSQKEPELMDSEELDAYLYQLERSSKMLSDHNSRKCGHFNPNLRDEFEFPEEKMQRVIQGTKAKRGHHPWQATIRTRGRSGKSTHWCGAVLISKRHLLTAAHCLMGYPKGAYFVRLGDHYANIAESSEIDVFIENWYIHEDFRKGSHMNNDIALVVLKSPVRFNDYIQPICLPPKYASYEAGKICTISGWGSIQSGISTPSNHLRAAQVPIIDNAVCKRPIVYGNTITDGMFCAGYLDEGTDACDGDSGGPLVCGDDGAETLYGIISWGQHCGYANKPGVYVKIAHYIDWIHSKISHLMQSSKNHD